VKRVWAPVTAARTISKAALSTPTGASPPLDQEIIMPIPRILQGKLAPPVIGAPLFIVCGPELVIAQYKAGIVGAFPALNARPKELLEECAPRASCRLREGESGEARGSLLP
jgi:hypothetical protein